MISRNILFLICLLLSSATAGQLGINISLPERGGTFVDIVKENYRWTKASTGASLAATDVDTSGWPKCDADFILDERPVAEWAGSVDDPASYHQDLRGTCKGSLRGKASVRSTGQGSVQNLSYDSLTNTTTFDFSITDAPAPGGGFIALEFTNTRRSAGLAVGSGFTDFRLVRPSYSLLSPKLYTDDFLAALSGINFSAIRFMPFTNPNGIDPLYPATTPWSKRKLVTDAAQNAITPLGKPDGAAWEYVINLANTVNKDAWINIPISADAGYVRHTAQLFKDSLKPNLNLYVESSNEVWNTAPGYEQSAYNKSWAQALGITEHQNHARRAVSLAMSFDSVFGPGSLNKRVRVVLCSHKPMLKWWVEPMLQYINTTFGPPKNYIWAIGCQTYFTGGVDAGESVAKILSDCHADIQSQVDETGQTNEAGRKQWIAKAKSWQLAGGFVSYEGGPDHGGGSTTNIANRILAERDRQMGELLKYNYDTCFLALDGALAMQFTLSSGYNRYGCWGLTDDITKPDRNYKYAAIKSIVGGAGTVTTPSHLVTNGISATFPTPGHLLVRFNANPPKNVAVVVYSVAGKVAAAKTLSVTSGSAELNLESLRPGIYLLSLRYGKSKFTKKIGVCF
jgi:hypothetical protein